MISRFVNFLFLFLLCLVMSGVILGTVGLLVTLVWAVLHG
jgi:hypothetical protein